MKTPQTKKDGKQNGSQKMQSLLSQPTMQTIESRGKKVQEKKFEQKNGHKYLECSLCCRPPFSILSRFGKTSVFHCAVFSTSISAKQKTFRPLSFPMQKLNFTDEENRVVHLGCSFYNPLEVSEIQNKRSDGK
ncbi:hypothetical protein CEXT_326831 [Caerostris extrusa]|uniref:Uncharacterized protein n=1 Tax=Caerostris extrusa TaxID=172846 RepID=A0AAV4T461_CAEEX|nr:hypothetical protein CEXT_326831 [Caerostris extrusa]